MKDFSDECMTEQSDYDEHAVFMEHVIKDDYDLLAIDFLLRDAFSER